MSNLAEETHAEDIVLQNSIQNLVEVVYNCMRIIVPVYNLHEVRVEHSIRFLRYHACLCSPLFSRSMVSVERFTKIEYDAKEDVAVLLMHRLLCATGRRIHDYNYYNVQILSKKLQNARDANFELNMEIATLKAENKLLSDQLLVTENVK